MNYQVIHILENSMFHLPSTITIYKLTILGKSLNYEKFIITTNIIYEMQSLPEKYFTFAILLKEY